MGTNYKDLLTERLRDEDFKKEYETLTPEYKAIKEELNAGEGTNTTKGSKDKIWETKNS